MLCFLFRVDTIEHFLVHCDKTYSFWPRIFNWWAVNIKVLLQVDTYKIVFGIPNERNGNIVNQLNYFIIIKTYYIWGSLANSTILLHPNIMLLYVKTTMYISILLTFLESESPDLNKLLIKIHRSQSFWNN